jgi:hypothetical protein
MEATDKLAVITIKVELLLAQEALRKVGERHHPHCTLDAMSAGHYADGDELL